jgi:hypothetical protein
MREDLENSERRAFIRRAATLGATAPAAALLLSASGKTASAGVGVPPDQYGNCPPGFERDGNVCIPIPR